MEIHKPLSKLEIKKAIFSMRALKAPGPVELHSLFFQSQWDMEGESICSIVLDIFAHLQQIRWFNKTFIMLISKVDAPEYILQFRLLSLCDVIYKAITKIIVN